MTYDTETSAKILTHIKLRDLWLCPARKQQLAEKDWAVLSDPSATPAAVDSVLRQQRLVTDTQLKQLDRFSQQLHIDKHVLFANATLSEKFDCYLRLHDAVEGSIHNQKIMQEAATTAIIQAKNLRDFAGYLQFYLCCARKLHLECFAPSIRMARVKLVQDAMSIGLQEYLHGPHVSTPPSPAAVTDVLSDWFLQENRLGFSDLANGLMLTTRHIPLLNLTYTEIIRAARDFVRHMQVFFACHQATSLQLSQTGEQWIYEFRYPEVTARLILNKEGQLTLDTYLLTYTQTHNPIAEHYQYVQ
jgi:hypothetical protein